MGPHTEGPLEAEMGALNVADGRPHSKTRSEQGDCACASTKHLQCSNDEASCNSLGMCNKCKECQAEFVIRRQSKLCFTCLESQVVAKMRTAVRGRGLGSSNKRNRIALALSGGKGSASLLYLLDAIRSRNIAQREKYKIPFDLDVIHVAEADESPAERAWVERERNSPQFASLDVQIYMVNFDSVFESEEADEERRKKRLKALLEMVDDVTGREDLKNILRHHLLVRTAFELGCDTLALGYDATSLAVRSIAAAAKGCGYSLPSDTQLVDGRYGETGPVVFYPLREISREEIDALCTRLNLSENTEDTKGSGPGAGAEIQTGAEAIDKRNINSLAATFLQAISKHNPGAVNNVNSTISKLEPFSWNNPADVAVGLPKAKVSDSLCPLCCAPLAAEEVLKTEEDCKRVLAIRGLCDSCRHQIFGCLDGFPNVDARVFDILKLLPKDIVARIEMTGAAPHA